MMTQSEGPGSHSDTRKTEGWFASSLTAIRRWLDARLLNNSIVVYRVEDPYTEPVVDEDSPPAARQRARYSSGELRF